MTFELEGEHTTGKVMGLDRDDVEDNVVDQIQAFLDHEAFQNPVRIMPDTHVGSGCTIGFTMPFEDRIVPNAVGVDVGCFTGDTEVKLLDGESHPIEELAEQGDEFYVYSCTEEGEIRPAEATARRTRTDAPLMEVELDNGRVVTCTPDHEFMLRDGEYSEAQKLESGDSLMPLYMGEDRDGYKIVFSNDRDEPYGDRVHRLVAESKFVDGPSDDEETVVHHTNFQKEDNRPENLEYMTPGEHSALHAEERDLDHWQSEEFEEKRIQAVKDREPTEHEREVAVENITTWMTENPEEFREVAEDAGERGKEHLEDFNTNERTCSICGEVCDNPASEYWHQVKEHPDETEYELSKNAKAAQENHKVGDVRKIDQTEDVYCLNVPEYHNFALDAGVFVHNCGMRTDNYGAQLEDLTDEEIDDEIRDAVPMGFTVHSDTDYHVGNDFPWDICTAKLSNLEENLDTTVGPGWFDGYGLDYFKDLCHRVGADMMRAINSIGTLGGGNHFVEISEGQDGDTWITIHSGSRGIGLSVAQYWQERATWHRSREFIQNNVPAEHWQYVVPDRDDDELTEWFLGGMGESYIDSEAIREDVDDNYRIGEIHDEIREGHPQNRTAEVDHQFIDDGDLDYLEGEEAHGYFIDMIFAQTYAQENRRQMFRQIEEQLEIESLDAIESIHNYLDFKDLTIRKGACRAHKPERVILPFDMKHGTLLLEAKGNDDWNNSSPHGAGRVMSRTEAKDTLDQDDVEQEMSDAGIHTSTVPLDEAPDAYKPAELIEQAIEPTAEVINRLEPRINIKADD